jgi:Na+/phosphate symporter
VGDAIISQIIPIFQEEAWNQQCKIFSDDIARKLDHLELKPLKEWLLRRLKALNDKLKKQNQGHVIRLKALNDKLKKQNQAHVRRLKALNDKLPTG